jgi:hypothetical protein
VEVVNGDLKPGEAVVIDRTGPRPTIIRSWAAHTFRTYNVGGCRLMKTLIRIASVSKIYRLEEIEVRASRGVTFDIGAASLWQ